jgi:hypothetical protein
MQLVSRAVIFTSFRFFWVKEAETEKMWLSLLLRRVSASFHQKKRDLKMGLPLLLSKRSASFDEKKRTRFF